MIERLEAVVLRLQPRRIVELGVASGGSTAFLATLARPERLIAIERKADRIPELDAFPCIHVAYGTDQADRAAIREVVGDEPLDLVVDDASHLLDLTRTSFNILFPRLRPGGVYVIEDWAWAHADYGDDGGQRLSPSGEALTQLVVELLMTCGSANDIVSNLYATPGTVEIVRGPAPLDEAFDIAQSFRSHAPLPGAGTHGGESTALRQRLARHLPHRSSRGSSGTAA